MKQQRNNGIWSVLFLTLFYIGSLFAQPNVAPPAPPAPPAAPLPPAPPIPPLPPMPPTNDEEGHLGVSLKEIVTESEAGKVRQVLIADVFEESAAAEAGLQSGDIITAINGKPVKSLTQLTHLIKANAPGETITLDYVRAGVAVQTTATLKAAENKSNYVNIGERRRIEWNEKGEIKWNGNEPFSVQLPPFRQKTTLGLMTGEDDRKGLPITFIEPNGAAEAAGLKVGDVLVSINGRKIRTKGDLEHTLDRRREGEVVSVRYRRNDVEQETEVRLQRARKIFLFDSENQHIRWENTDEKWNIEWFEDSQNLLGAELKDTTTGVKIIKIEKEAAAKNAGLKAGDIITALEGETVQNLDELTNLLKGYKVGETITVGFQRENKTAETELTLGRKRISIDKPKDLDFIFDEIEEEEEVVVEISERNALDSLTTESGIELSYLDLFPNPSQGVFKLSFEAAAVPTIVSVRNADGKIVFTKDLQQFNGKFEETIDLTKEGAGRYEIIIKQGDETVIKSISIIE